MGCINFVLVVVWEKFSYEVFVVLGNSSIKKVIFYVEGGLNLNVFVVK